MDDLARNIHNEEPMDLTSVSENLEDTVQCNTQLIQPVKSNLVDDDLLDEVRTIAGLGYPQIYFGKTLRDIQIVLEDDEQRKHEINLQYKGPKKLVITGVKLPHSSVLNDREYGCLHDIIVNFSQIVKELVRYFYELDNIDQFCAVMEPLEKSFKDSYRRIFLDDKTWLHVEVTPEGFATNIHLVGQSEGWHNMLQAGLLNWDHDKNIVDNIMATFEFSQFPQPITSILELSKLNMEDDSIACRICLSTKISGVPGLPLPFCQNSSCGVYYHRNCLYQWLVSCAGSRPPAFGVANGQCPTCLQPITCSEKDD